jgi:Uma2 family endonuclease
VIWTYQDLELMPPDGRRHEILDGEWVVTPAPNTKHQTVSKRLQFELMLQLEHKKLGIVFDAPTDVIFSNTRTTEPDLLVVAVERKNIISERGIEGAPDLVMEILSTSTERTDREVKRKLYAEAGVREYWLVDPRTSRIEVLSLRGVSYESSGEYGPGATARSEIFPFSVAVDNVFADD